MIIIPVALNIGERCGTSGGSVEESGAKLDSGIKAACLVGIVGPVLASELKCEVSVSQVNEGLRSKVV